MPRQVEQPYSRSMPIPYVTLQGPSSGLSTSLDVSFNRETDLNPWLGSRLSRLVYVPNLPEGRKTWKVALS